MVSPRSSLKLEQRIMRYELSDHEWGVIDPMLPNKPRGIPRIDGRRARNLIERIFNKIKQCQRIATRYDKRALNYLAVTWPSSSSHQSAFGYALMSPDPSEFRALRNIVAHGNSLLSELPAIWCIAPLSHQPRRFRMGYAYRSTALVVEN